MSGNNYPRLHNAMWPGLVGKGPDSEPPIDLDTMLRLTAAARANGAKFEGVDLFLADPHTSIDSTKDDIKRLADKISGHGLAVGSVVAPVWPPVGGGSAMGSAAERKQFLTMVEKACGIARQLSDIGIRKSGVVRIDSATGVHDWAAHPAESQKAVAKTFSEACDVAEQYGERLAAEGEICWGGMHSWKHMVGASGNGRAPEDARFPGRHGAHDALHAGLQRARASHSARRTTTGRTARRSTARSRRLRTRCGHGRSTSTSPRTTRPSKAKARTTRPGATAWSAIRTESSTSPITPASGCATTRAKLTKVCKHICWDGCMFPNSEMMKQKTWDDILGAMVAVRDAHGWIQ